MSNALIVLRFRQSPTIKQWMEWHREYKSFDMYIKQDTIVAYNQCFSKFISFLLMMDSNDSVSIFIDGAGREDALLRAKRIFGPCLKDAQGNTRVDQSYISKGFSFAF